MLRIPICGRKDEGLWFRSRYNAGTVKWLFGIAVSVISVGSIIGCGGNDNDDELSALKLSRGDDVAKAYLLYTADHDDTLPLANKWVDGLGPYVRDPRSFNSPAVPEWGFALNEDAAGRPITALDPNMIVIFDSTLIERNATVPTTTLPVPPRYKDGNLIIRANGDVDGSTDGPPNLATARDRIRQTGIAILMYASDWDDVLPTANWADPMLPYVRSERNYRSPMFDNDLSKYGFAMNEAIGGKRLLDVDQATTLSFFDSTDLSRSAVAPTSTEPNPGRYGGVNAAVYLDGRVR